MDTNAISALSEGSGTFFGFSAGGIIASLIWSSIGVGFSIYGKKQRSAGPWIGGLALVGISCLITSALWMSVAAVAIIAGIWWYARYSN
ncbi:MAG TPA: hypothetical protein VGO59_18425 [Verrucomicrobiae bacterium]|jgi:hypothetical protein